MSTIKSMFVAALFLIVVTMGQAQADQDDQASDAVGYGLLSAGPTVVADSELAKSPQDWLGPIIDQVAKPAAFESLHSDWLISPPFVPPFEPVQKGVVNSKEPINKPIKKQPLAKIAILIDDLGYNHKGMDSALALPANVALAILPLTPFAKQTATRSKVQQRVTLLHAPMENTRELKLGPGGLYVKMDEQELKQALIKDIDSLPGIKGVNNHMGSLLTTKQDSMDWVMQVLHKRSLFFIDSLTSAKSVAQKTAQDHGLKTTKRDVFLDNIRSEKAIDKQFTRLIKKAKQHGSALAIGHPYPETMSYLKKRLVDLEKEGVQLVPLTSLLHAHSATTHP